MTLPSLHLPLPANGAPVSQLAHLMMMSPPKMFPVIAVLTGVTLLSLLTSGYASAQTNPTAKMPSGSGQAAVCTDEDRKYAASIAGGSADEAYQFGLTIQKFVEARDLKSLFGLAADELDNGPRRRFVQNKSFSEIFSEEWRQRVLSQKPGCRPVGWRGYMLGRGLIWFDKIDGRWSIFSINGASVEPVDSEPWSYDGRLLTRACFMTPWLSLDNYEEYREQFSIGRDFDITPGRYIGGAVPLEPIVSSWGERLTLAMQLSECLSTRKSSDVEVAEGWVHTEACGEFGCYDHSYSAIRRLPPEHCGSLASNFPDNCVDLRLVQTVDQRGGSMGVDINFSIFAIVEEPVSKEAYVMPLVNFDNLNSALNYLDALER